MEKDQKKALFTSYHIAAEYLWTRHLHFDMHRLITRLMRGTTIFIRTNTDMSNALVALTSSSSNVFSPDHISMKKLDGREFCSILNDVIRNDEPEEMAHAIMLIRAINRFSHV